MGSKLISKMSSLVSSHSEKKGFVGYFLVVILSSKFCSEYNAHLSRIIILNKGFNSIKPPRYMKKIISFEK